MNDVITLDVREDIRGGREPFSKIMTTVAALHDGQELLLVAPFEPVPLFAVLNRQGFDHAARQVSESHWEIRFLRKSLPLESNEHVQRSKESAIHPQSPILDVDARGLEPPQPMIKILESLVSLAEGAALRARTDRRPVHLYPHLEERGFTAQSEEQPDGSFITTIARV